MSLATIVPALVTLLSGTPGITTVLDYVPQTDLDAADLPAIMIDPQAAIMTENMSKRRVTWPIDLVVLACVKGLDGAADLAIARPLPEAIIAQLDSSVTLGGLLDRAIFYPQPAMEPVSPIPWKTKTYIGFVLLPLLTTESVQRFAR